MTNIRIFTGGPIYNTRSYCNKICKLLWQGYFYLGEVITIAPASLVAYCESYYFHRSILKSVAPLCKWVPKWLPLLPVVPLRLSDVSLGEAQVFSMGRLESAPDFCWHRLEKLHAGLFSRTQRIGYDRAEHHYSHTLPSMVLPFCLFPVSPYPKTIQHQPVMLDH